MSATRAALLVQLMVLSACGAQQSSIDLPNLSSQLQRVEAQSTRMKLILQVMDDDVAQAQRARSTFFEVARERYARPFPLDLFKQTAMSCLNQPLGLSEPVALPVSEAQRALTSQDAPMTCTPESLDLLVKTARAQSAGTLALVALQMSRVDTMRTLRAKVRVRTSKLEPLLIQQRLFLDRERLELRRLRRRVNTRRDDYDGASVARARARLNSLQLRLNVLDERIRALEGRALNLATRLPKRASRLLLWVVVAVCVRSL